MDMLVLQLNRWGAVWCDHAGAMLMQSSLLILLLLAADRILRRKLRPALRYGLWLLVILKLLLPPGLALPTGVGYWLPRTAPVKISTSSAPDTTESNSPTGISVSLVSPSESIESETAAPATANSIPANHSATAPLSSVSTPKLPTPAGLLLFGWILGAAWLTIRLALRWRYERAVMMNSRPATGLSLDILESLRRELCLRATVSLRWSSDVHAPAICGLVRPVVLLPEGLESRLGEQHLRRVVLHELSHVQRGDLWINFFQSLLSIAYFFHPLVWLANSRIRQVREQAVDECVLARMGGGAADYSRMLVEMAEGIKARPGFSLGLIGILESRNRLEERIRLMLERPTPKRPALGRRGLITILIVGCLVLPMAGAQIARQLVVPAATFVPAEASTTQQIDHRFREIGDTRLNAFREGNAQNYLASYTPQLLVLNDRKPAATTAAEVLKEFEQSRSQLERLNGLEWRNIKYWLVGDDVYVAWQLAMTFKTREIPMLLTDYQKGISIFTRREDGSLGLHWDCWNLDALPSSGNGQPARVSQPELLTLSRQEQPTLEPGDLRQLYKQIAELEDEFHRLFVTGRKIESVEYYTADALLLPLDQAPVEGRDAIRRHLDADRTDMLKIKQTPTAIEGDGQIIRVANSFEWTIREPSLGGQVVTIPGKGIHVWRREGDGWKIFLDVHNISVPMPPAGR